MPDSGVKSFETGRSRYYEESASDPMVIDENASFPRKVYWFYKNMFRQKMLFRQIEKLREELDVKVFIGVFSGALPLVFYLKQKPRTAAVLFSDMDSWFSDVHTNMKKLWYRKYYSFNYLLENADAIDFLSSFILEGIKSKDIRINENNVFVSPCSFADYSECIVGDKTNFEIAFASRLEPNKNPLLFLRAAKIISKEYPDVKYHLLGEGSLAYKIEKFINENNLREVINFQFHSNPPDIFKNTSIFVSLQSGTNYPSQSILEAMACGNAVVASNTGDTKMLVNENIGLLIDLDVEELSLALRTLITNRDKVKQLGESAHNYVLKNHTIEKFTDYYIDLIRRVHEHINDIK